MERIVNLEHDIAQISYEIADKKILGQNVVDKALGILVNDGLYAMWLFIEEKGEKKKTFRIIHKVKLIKVKIKTKRNLKSFVKN